MNIHASSGLLPSLSPSVPRDGFGGAKVLVIGDVMLDRYIIGGVSRISPEAPVPVLAVQKERAVAGGASNVALNVAGLKGKAYLAGVIGKDAPAQRLCGILDEHGIDWSGLLPHASRPTTCKTRVMCDNHQIVRLDEECMEDLDAAASEELLRRVIGLLASGMDSVILSDYAKGVLGRAFTEAVISECNTRHIPVLVDPKRDNYMPYSGATCITPNQKEFKAAVTAMGLSGESLSTAAFGLRERLRCGTLLVTQGADGMTLFTREHSHHYPALAEEVFDVSGAGDTVIATIATGLAAGMDILTAVQLSNVAASLVVRRAGTAPIIWEDLHELLSRGAREHSGVETRTQPNQFASIARSAKAAG